MAETVQTATNAFQAMANAPVNAKSMPKPFEGISMSRRVEVRFNITLLPEQTNIRVLCQNARLWWKSLDWLLDHIGSLSSLMITDDNTWWSRGSFLDNNLSPGGFRKPFPFLLWPCRSTFLRQYKVTFYIILLKLIFIYYLSWASDPPLPRSLWACPQEPVQSAKRTLETQ